MSTNASWKYLSGKPKSLYKQLFIHNKGRWYHAGPRLLSPQEMARLNRL